MLFLCDMRGAIVARAMLYQSLSFFLFIGRLFFRTRGIIEAKRLYGSAPVALLNLLTISLQKLLDVFGFFS